MRTRTVFALGFAIGFVVSFLAAAAASAQVVVVADSTPPFRVVAVQTHPDSTTRTDTFDISPGNAGILTVNIKRSSPSLPTADTLPEGMIRWVVSDSTVLEVRPLPVYRRGADGVVYSADVLTIPGAPEGATARVGFIASLPVSANPEDAFPLFWQLHLPAFYECSRLVVPHYVASTGATRAVRLADFEGQTRDAGCVSRVPAVPSYGYVLELAVNGPDARGLYGVKGRTLDLAGAVVTPSPLAVIEIVGGSWGDGSTQPRVCQPNSADGGCGVGNVVAGSVVRMTLTLDGAVLAAPVEARAGA